ncbi:MAG: hypothetical protein HC915_09115 [Anaerolineae bacterium]|nr:hypothetical protein [Anaerolineae bacterium]
MSIRTLDERQLGLRRSQVVNSLVILLVAAGLMGIGVLMRSSTLAATQELVQDEAGIRAQIPVNWLVDTDDPRFVLQAQDPSAVPFKTTLRVAILPVGEGASPRNVVEFLILQRAALSAFRVLSIESITLNEQSALEMNYAYVEEEPNPFLSALPVVVQGRDVVVIRGQQAIVATFLEERSRFIANEFLFDNFLTTLEY